MSKILYGGTWLLTCVAALLIGCATPKPIRALADQGTATIGLAEASLRDYLDSTNAQLGARMELLRLDSQARTRELASREVDAVLGFPMSTPAAELLRDLGNEYRKIREKESRELERLAKEFTPDTSVLLTAPTEELATARKSFSLLAQELSPKEWFKLSTGYAKAIAKGMGAEREDTAGGDDNQE